jgi:hypothetical protein
LLWTIGFLDYYRQLLWWCCYSHCSRNMNQITELTFIKPEAFSAKMHCRPFCVWSIWKYVMPTIHHFFKFLTWSKNRARWFNSLWYALICATLFS